MALTLSPKDRAKIATKLGARAAEQDIDLALNVVDALLALWRRNAPHAPEFKYDVAALGTDDTLTIVWKRGIVTLDVDAFDALAHLSTRFDGARLDVERVWLRVTFGAFAATAPSHRVTVPRSRKRRRRDFDYAAARIGDTDDQASLERLVDDVYALEPIMPALAIVVEPIVDRRALFTVAEEATASETDVEGAAPEGARIGYSLYFGNLPASLDCTRLVELVNRQRHPNVLRAYVWFRGNGADPLLVINVRRPNELSASDTAGCTAVRAYCPRTTDSTLQTNRR